MITTELKSLNTTVRIHDDYCQMKPIDDRLFALNRIVTDSYKRRVETANNKSQVIANASLPQS